MAVPDSATTLVPAPLPPVTLRVAVFAPPVVGLNTTLTVQLAPAATDVPQVWLTTNWLMLTRIELIGSDTVPVFVSVTTCAAEVPPDACSPNSSAVGASSKTENFCGVVRAAYRARAPPVTVFHGSAAIGRAVLRIAARSWPYVQVACWLRRRAAAPV